MANVPLYAVIKICYTHSNTELCGKIIPTTMKMLDEYTIFITKLQLAFKL